MNTAFLIAAPSSGSGKTTIARGLMALLTRKGYSVQPFKCGPDYIDTKFHEAVCGRPSINLDTFMATPDHVRELFTCYGGDADVCIVEGMMGLYDGYDRDRGSSAEVARVLDIPVVLVVDAKSAAYSMAALLSGFINFRSPTCSADATRRVPTTDAIHRDPTTDATRRVPTTDAIHRDPTTDAIRRVPTNVNGDRVRFAGVIFNKVGSERHFGMLRQVCDDLQIPCLGYLPKSAELEQGSRYLGLDFSKLADSDTADSLLRLLEEHIDLNRLMGCSDAIHRVPTNTATVADCSCLEASVPTKSNGRVLIARNAESFSFIYQETIDRFFGRDTSHFGRDTSHFGRDTSHFGRDTSHFGRDTSHFGRDTSHFGRDTSHFGRDTSRPYKIENVTFFDPETDVPTFDDVDLLYLPGGYPEKHLEALVSNEACRRAIRDFAEKGGRVFAECGGMMYLCKNIVTDPASDVQLSSLSEYAMCGVLPFTISARKSDRKLSLGYRRFVLDGQEYRGHEFHYTQFLGGIPESVTQVYNGKGEPVSTPVFKYKNVLASYTHLYNFPAI